MKFRFLLFFALVVNQISMVEAAVMDSLRVEKQRGRKYIIHRVEPKETLYSIGRKYGVTPDDITSVNDSMNNGLQMFQEIKIPILKNVKMEPVSNIETETAQYHIVKPSETLFGLSKKYNCSVDSLVKLNDLKAFNIGIGDTLILAPRVREINLPQPVEIAKTEEPIASTTQETSKIHVVRVSETLFSISKRYGIKVRELKSWNDLKSNNLSLGQRLIVEEAKPDSIVEASTTKEDPVKIEAIPEKAPLDTLFVKNDNSKFKTKITLRENETMVEEEGFAMRIEDTDHTKKFLALHRSAPLGSVLMVKNEMTNRIISVRVVGRLSESGLNENLLLRLSYAAFQVLGALDSKIPIQVTYAK